MLYLKSLLISLSLLLPLSLVQSTETSTLSIKSILEFEINSSINPATLSYLKAGFEKAQQTNSDLIIIKMNTPGGLVTTTKDIMTLIGESDIPVAIWITPEGASATSAGAIIASSAHILVMNEGTNIGAATPIQMSGDIKQKDAKSKSINDLVALVKSLSFARGRNPDGFSKMITDASSFDSKTALKEKLIDGIAHNYDEFYQVLEKKVINKKGLSHFLKVENPRIETFEMDLGQKLLDIFANPSMAYILFLIGAALLYLELQAPGGFIAGALGVTCLVLAGIGFQVLPLNFGALGLIVLSFVLLILEIYVTSYGILSLAGVGCLVAGSLFLFRTDNAYLELSTSVIFSAISAIGVFLLIVVYVITRDHKNIGKTQFNSVVGKRAEILESLPAENEGEYLYTVKVGGEIWKASSQKKFSPGDHADVNNQKTTSMSLEIS